MSTRKIEVQILIVLRKNNNCVTRIQSQLLPTGMTFENHFKINYYEKSNDAFNGSSNCFVYFKCQRSDSTWS